MVSLFCQSRDIATFRDHFIFNNFVIMAESSELKQEVIEGVTVYRITVGNYDKTDYQGDPDQKALQRMKESGWWGDQSEASEGLRPEYLSAVFQKKSGRSHSDLSSPGVYMYLKKSDNRIYIGSAVNETLLERQTRHLEAAAYTSNVEGLDKFDQQLCHHYNQAHWHFYAIPMSAGDPDVIHEKEKDLIAQYNSKKHGYNE